MYKISMWNLEEIAKEIISPHFFGIKLRGRLPGMFHFCVFHHAPGALHVHPISEHSGHQCQFPVPDGTATNFISTFHCRKENRTLIHALHTLPTLLLLLLPQFLDILVIFCALFYMVKSPSAGMGKSRSIVIHTEKAGCYCNNSFLNSKEGHHTTINLYVPTPCKFHE